MRWIFSLLLFFSVSAAQAQVMLCDSPDQVEQVFRLKDAQMSWSKAFEIVNLIADKKDACGMVTVAARFLEEVKDIDLAKGPFTIIKVLVVGVIDGDNIRPAPYKEQYAIKPKAPPKVKEEIA